MFELNFDVAVVFVAVVTSVAVPVTNTFTGTVWGCGYRFSFGSGRGYALGDSSRFGCGYKRVFEK